MKVKTALTFILCLFCVVFTGASQADDSFRCRSRIIQLGDTKAEVLLKCGEPLSRDFLGARTRGYFSEGLEPEGGESRGPRGGYVERSREIEMWVYDFGPRKFIRILTFRGGILKEIRKGHYGMSEGE